MVYFYAKFVVIESLLKELNNLDLSESERHHLASLADSSLHHAILDEILSELSPIDKKAFIHRLKENPEDPKIMDFLNEKIEGVEGRIAKVSEDLVKELHKDIEEAEQNSRSALKK